MLKIKKRLLTFLEHIRKDSLGKAILTGCIEGMRSRGKQQATYLMSLCEWMEEQGQGVIVKC